jgi:hypothetical protein
LLRSARNDGGGVFRHETNPTGYAERASAPSIMSMVFWMP